MVEEYVSRQEFNILKKDVQDLKEIREKDSQLLISIDKKVDIISERLSSADKTDELKLQPLTERVKKLEENHSWLSKTLGATIIGIIIKLIFDISKLV